MPILYKELTCPTCGTTYEGFSINGPMVYCCLCGTDITTNCINDYWRAIIKSFVKWYTPRPISKEPECQVRTKGPDKTTMKCNGQEWCYINGKRAYCKRCGANYD